MVRSIHAFALLLACSAACSSAQSKPDATTAVFRVPVSVQTDSGMVVFQSEVADEPAERQRGLMFRESMGAREGMIFLFPTESPRSFWMRNTLIPLDMLFIKADRTVLGIVENAVPKTDTSRSVPGSSQFVLEINGGLSAELGIRAGAQVVFMAPVPER